MIRFTWIFLALCLLPTATPAGLCPCELLHQLLPHPESETLSHDDSSPSSLTDVTNGHHCHCLHRDQSFLKTNTPLTQHDHSEMGCCAWDGDYLSGAADHHKLGLFHLLDPPRLPSSSGQSIVTHIPKYSTYAKPTRLFLLHCSLLL